MNRRGRIFKGIGGFYYVLLDSGETVTCKARGKFRSRKIVPTVGDLVEISTPQSGYASVAEILPRKNLLARPSVANIDQLIIVVSACVPKPDWMLVDKLLLQTHTFGVEPLLLLNKIDIGDDSIISAFQSDYASFRTLMTSTKTGEGLAGLKNELSGRISCFAGQSAVGKSSLLNALFPQLSLETGGLAKKTDRGRHTTRRAELWPLLGGAVLDTPGFSLLDLKEYTQETLNQCWPEFGSAYDRCRFAGCRHLSEPGCAVKALLDSGELTRSRYERYSEICLENEQRRKHRYD